MYNIEWVQHPVGHGGFHVGSATTDRTSLPFTWIFDCGSKRPAKLNTYVQAWCRSHPFPIDWLFISHFDKDHVSGLDELMSRSATANVMVPYVNVGELAITLLEEVARDRLDRWFVDLTADPAVWLLGRGAGRVLFLRGGGGEPLTEEPIAPEPGSRGGEDGGWRTKITPAPRPLELGAVAGVLPDAQAAEVDSPCEVYVYAGGYGLRLKPYCETISASTHAQLLVDLAALVGNAAVTTGRPGLGDLAYAIAAHARTNTGRAALRQIFAKHVGSSNRSSMSLLSAPLPAAGGSRSFHFVFPYRLPQTVGSRSAPAWVNTGDAELLPPAALAAWKAHYLADLPQVEVLAVPHHGSDHNSNASFQQLAPNALLMAHTKAGAKKHPGPGVAGAAGSRLVQVTNDPGSAVRMLYRES